MIFKKLSVTWKVNTRLKSSVKYKKSFFDLVIEIPESIAEKSSEEKNLIIDYIELKRKGKHIPSFFKKRFSGLFPLKSLKQKKYNLDDSIFSLRNCLDELNSDYFNKSCNISKIYWTSHPSKRTLGRYFDFDKSISITSFLNKHTVPKMVIDYIVYHEMCHQMFPPYALDGKRKVHHREFKKAEQEFKMYSEAKIWIANNIK